MAIIKQGKIDKLEYLAFETRAEMGEYSAREAAAEINRQIKEKGEINMIFAAAPSQNDFLASLINDKTIDWTKIHAFHMDEYIGLPADAP
ncbi:MAG: glucosamine-6-phosphate deaminase, partial [Clostridia bacterium]|nr:glucosamine-6-phosphate deaminase [Clostridia bacterium]